MISRYLTICGLAVLLTGCGAGSWFSKIGGSQDNVDPPVPLVAIETQAELIKLWSLSVGKGADKHFLKLLPGFAQGRVFVADRSGNLVSADAVSGEILWRTQIGSPVTSGVGICDDLALVGTEEGGVLAYSSATGKPLWRAQVSSEVLAPPRGAEGVVIVRTLDGRVFGLDADNGERLWSYQRTVPALTLRGTSAPVISGEVVIVGFDGGRISSLELLTGKLLWETSVSLGSGRSQLERMADIDFAPVVIANDIYVATFQGQLASIALESGRIIWNRDISSHAGLTSDGANIYVTDDQSYVWALQRDNGRVLWKQENLYARQASAPATVGDLVVVGDFEGYLHWMDKNSGQFVARTRASKQAILTAPIVVQDIAYIYGSDGTLSAYTPGR